MAYISSKFNINNWKLTLPVDTGGGSGGRAAEVTRLTGFEDVRHFHLGPDGSMILTALVDGATTSGTKYARSELREMSNGSEAAWNPAQGGVMTATLSVNELPVLTSGAAGKIIIGQVHGEDEELVRLYYDDGHLYFVNDQAGAKNSEMHFEFANAKGAAPSVELGEKFSYKIEVTSKLVTVTILADGETYVASTAVNAVWKDDKLYFKAGVYMGVNKDTGSGNGEVAFYGLDFGHSAGAGLGGLTNLSLPTATVDLTGAADRDVLRGGAKADTLNGDGGDDLLNGNGGNDRLYGGAGEDRLNGGAGGDRMVGEDGNDTYIVDATADVVVEVDSRGLGGEDLVLSSVSYTLSQYVEGLTLTGIANLNGYGNAAANTLTGNAGANVLDGGTGADMMRGLAGNDTYYVDNTADLVIEVSGGGKDMVISSASFTLGEQVEALTLTGTAVSGTGNDLANAITGNAADNTLRGLAGNDILDGGEGRDTLVGGAGDDTYMVDNSGDRAVESIDGGHDMVKSTVSFTLGENVDDLSLTELTAIIGRGNDLDNKITGSTANNILAGGLGADTLSGSTGDDTFLFDTRLGGGNIDLISDFKSKHDMIDLDHLAFGNLHLGKLTAADFVNGTAATNASQHIIYDQASGILYYDADGVGGQAQVAFARLDHMPSLSATDIWVV